MKFIEVHEKETNIRVLVPLDKILSISQSPRDLTAFIETSIDENNDGVGFYTKELYVEILRQIKKIA